MTATYKFFYLWAFPGVLDILSTAGMQIHMFHFKEDRDHFLQQLHLPDAQSNDFLHSVIDVLVPKLKRTVTAFLLICFMLFSNTV